MTTTATHVYGTNVIEIEKHSDEELQKLIKQREVQYFRNCMSPAYPDLGVNVSWINEEPLTQALNELASWFKNGYTVETSLCRPLYLSVQLKKPATIIDADLLEVAEQAKVKYTADRYERNRLETRRQMDITISRRAREAAAAKAKAEAELQVSEEEFALSDLLAAYSPKKASTAK
ncbi:hypothetical protein [Pseudomonas sp. LB3P14]